MRHPEIGTARAGVVRPQGPVRAGRHLVGLAVAALLALCPAAAPAAARDGGTPGTFDFYVLSLSWSPSYCAARKDGGGGEQCSSGRPYAFIVHGLWPQYERGYPSDCIVPAPSLSRGEVDAVLDLMPSRALVRHEWKKHGTCSGLDAGAYFAAVRKAREAVTVPAGFTGLSSPLTTAPQAVEEAFRAANPGLGADAISIQCRRDRLTEVRICMDRSFAFRPCPEVEKGSCRAASVTLPPVRSRP